MMELVYMYQQNKDLVIRTFLKDKYPWLKKVIYSQCNHVMLEQYQDELMQLSLVKLCDAFEMYRYEMNHDFLGYYFLIIKRMIIDFKRIVYRKIKMLDYYSCVYAFDVEDREVEYLSSLKEQSEYNSKIVRMYHTLLDELENYSDFEKKVIYYKLQGYKASEIGQMLGMNSYHVNYIIRKVRKQLKFKIDE